MTEDRIMTNLNYRLLNFHSKIIDDIFKELKWNRNVTDLEKAQNIQLLWMCRQVHNIDIVTMNPEYMMSVREFQKRVSLIQGKRQRDFCLKRYDFPDQVKKMQEDINNYEKNDDIKYLFVFSDRQMKSQSYIDLNTKDSESMLKNLEQADQLNLCFIHSTVKNSLIIYGNKVKLQFYALINNFERLNIQVFSETFVKLFSGYLFVDQERSSKAQLSMTEFFRLLEERGHTKHKINQIWDRCCKLILLQIFSIFDQMYLLSLNTFQIVQFEFEITQDLEVYCSRIKVDHKFPKRGNHLDIFKRVMLKEILVNIKRKILKQQILNQLKQSMNTPKFLYLLKRMKNDPNLSKSSSKFDNSIDVLLKEDYTKPKMRERTVRNISEELFSKIRSQQNLIKSGSTKCTNFDLLLQPVKVEKTLIPIFYHYKRGKIDLMNAFLQKASIDQPISHRKYQEYLNKWSIQNHKEYVELGQQDIFRRENQNDIIINKGKIIKGQNNQEYLANYEEEKDPHKVLKALLEQSQVYSFLQLLSYTKRFSENQLQYSLFEIFRDSKLNPQIFSYQCTILTIVNPQDEKIKEEFTMLLQYIKEKYDNTANAKAQLLEGQVNVQDKSNKLIKIFLKKLRKILILQESSKLQQYRTRFKNIEIKKCRSQRQFSYVRKQNISLKDTVQTLDQYLFGASQPKQVQGSTQLVRKFVSGNSTARLYKITAANRKTLAQHENDPQSTMTLADYEIDSNKVQGDQKEVPANQIKEKFSDMINHMQDETSIREAVLSSRGRESLMTPQSRNSFLYVKSPNESHRAQTPKVVTSNEKRCSSVMSKRLKSVVAREPNQYSVNYLGQLKERRRRAEQARLAKEEISPDNHVSQSALQPGFFSSRRQQKLEEEQKQIKMLKKRIAEGLNNKMKRNAKQNQIEQELINDNGIALKLEDDESNLEYSLQELEVESLRINSKKLREKYIEKVIDIHRTYKQQNTYMIRIFPFNEESRNLVSKIKYSQVLIQEDEEKEEEEYFQKKKPQRVFQLQNRDQIKNAFAKMVASNFDDYIFIRDTNTDILNCTATDNKEQHD
ncbi:UNKNOWN [Stylonychia lemnae]|uniref:Uncharacterized protein n=1 Tax=Stylonychia lemnae TaxID=5949 RepID=A0A078AQU0_STYLE|nr:UNKNOWN [Stylonychia lemnae]|eukprot:CDW84301.1 UNKNOWN [Stylonychia lemnae]